MVCGLINVYCLYKSKMTGFPSLIKVIPLGLGLDITFCHYTLRRHEVSKSILDDYDCNENNGVASVC